MLNARGVFRACRQLAVYRLKIVKTFPKTVLPSKCWHCVVLQLYLRGKIVFSGLALPTQPDMACLKKICPVTEHVPEKRIKQNTKRVTVSPLLETTAER
jgi:hypothetical protein